MRRWLFVLIAIVAFLLLATFVIPFPDKRQLSVAVTVRRYLDWGLSEAYSIDSVTGANHVSNLIEWGYVSPLLFGPPVQLAEVKVSCEGQVKHGFPLFMNPLSATIGDESKRVDVEFAYLSPGPHAVSVDLIVSGKTVATKGVTLDA